MHWEVHGACIKRAGSVQGRAWGVHGWGGWEGVQPGQMLVSQAITGANQSCIGASWWASAHKELGRGEIILGHLAAT